MFNCALVVYVVVTLREHVMRSTLDVSMDTDQARQYTEIMCSLWGTAVPASFRQYIQ